jgi:hypothetical protein
VRRERIIPPIVEAALVFGYAMGRAIVMAKITSFHPIFAALTVDGGSWSDLDGCIEMMKAMSDRRRCLSSIGF